MPAFAVTPAFIAYGVTLIVLILNLAVLWGYSGAARAKSKVAINPEDAALQKAAVSDIEPPAVARVLRAHANAQALIYPFLFLGLTYVLAGGSARTCEIIFALFTVGRIGHSIFYLAAKQPWRTFSFLLSVVGLISLMVALGIRLAG